MIVDPVEAMFKTSTRAALPTASPTGVLPIPSVIPDPEAPVQQFVGHTGSTTLWVIFAAMALASILFAAWSYRVPVSNRLYHVITTAVLIISTLSYWAMATGQSVSVSHYKIRHSHDHVPDTYTYVDRQVFWGHYVNWILTTPLLLTALSSLAGLSGAHTLMAVLANIVFVLFGLFSAFGTEGTPQKWGNYTIAIIGFLVVVWHLAFNGRAAVRTKSDRVAKFYTAIATYTIIVLAIYPIVWGIANGGRHISLDAEIVTYAVLDVLIQPVFGLWLLLTHAKVPETNVDLRGFWSTGLNPEGSLRLDDEEGA